MADAQLPPALAGDERFALLCELLQETYAGLGINEMLVYLVDQVKPAVLSHLAEQFSLQDEISWSLATSDTSRRRLLKRAIELHRYKGTPWSIKQALSRIGIERVALVEQPDGAHWAEFDADIGVVDRPLTEAIYPQITQLIDAYKPVRSRLRRLIVSVASRALLNVACATLAGDIVTVHPYQLTEITSPPMRPWVGIGQHDWGTTSVYPRAS